MHQNPNHFTNACQDIDGDRNSTFTDGLAAQKTGGRKTSLQPEDLLSCNNQLLTPNFRGSFNQRQKEIGPALTPLIYESDHDQGSNHAAVDNLVKVTKSLAGSLSDSNANHTDHVLEETQSPNRLILRNQHHQQQHNPPKENVQGDSMMIWGVLMFIFSSCLWIIGIPLILFDLDNFKDHLDVSKHLDGPTDSSFSGWMTWLLVKILDDQHYKFFIPLQITFGLVFVIVNWGGLKIFRHS